MTWITTFQCDVKNVLEKQFTIKFNATDSVQLLQRGSTLYNEPIIGHKVQVGDRICYNMLMGLKSVVGMSCAVTILTKVTI